MHSAVIYCRISRDDLGDGAGVARQEEDCRVLCERKGWSVTEVLTDNDVSAFTGRTRPAYSRLISMITAGSVDVVVAWAPERLHRSPRELEDFIDLLEHAGVAVETVKAGSWDVSTSHGRLVARMLGAVSRAESERIGERVSRAHQQAKSAGLWRGPIPYGMRPSTMKGKPEPDPDRVGVVQEIALRIQRGDALTAIAADLNVRGVPPKRGKRWSHTGVLRLMASPALGGMVRADGILQQAAFDGVLEESEWRSVQAAITRRPRGESRRPREALTLVGGLLQCAEHDVPLYGSSSPTSALYQANSVGVCWVRIPREPVDKLIRGLVVARLGRADARDVLVPKVRGESLDREQHSLQLRREELADLVANGALPGTVARPRLVDINQRLAEIEAAKNPGPMTAEDLLDPAEAWRKWTTVQRREVIRLLMAAITVRHSTPRNGPRADLSRVKVKWQGDPDESV